MVTTEDLEMKIEQVEAHMENLRRDFQKLENMFVNYRNAYYIIEDEIKIYIQMLKDYRIF